MAEGKGGSILQGLGYALIPQTMMAAQKGREEAGQKDAMAQFLGSATQSPRGLPAMTQPTQLPDGLQTGGFGTNSPRIMQTPPVAPREFMSANALPAIPGMSGGVPGRFNQFQLPGAQSRFQDMQKGLAAKAMPEAAGAAQIGALFPKAPEPYTLKENEIRYGSDNRPIAVGPTKVNDLPAEIQAALFAAGGDRDKAAQIINQWKNRPQTQINMGGDRAVTGVDASRYKATTETLGTLDTMAPFLERMQSSLASGMQTGFGQDWLLPLKQAAEEWTGTKIAGTSEQEVFKGIQGYLAPRLRVPGSGASSDRDISLLIGALPELSKSETGNLAISDMFGRIREYTTKVAQIQQDLLRQHDYIPITEERKRVEALGPIFSSDDRKNIEALKQGAPKAAAASVSGASTAPITQADIEFTAKKHNVTVDQVKKKLGLQ